MTLVSLGFVRYIRILDGNTIAPHTFEHMLDDMALHLHTFVDKPVVVMDTGIATKYNLIIVKQKGYDYVCVNRTKPKEYTKLSDKTITLYDNRRNKIEVVKAMAEVKSNTFLHRKSHKKDVYIEPHIWLRLVV